MHALAHGFELRRHQPGRLRSRQSQCILKPGRVEVEQHARRRGGGMGAEDRAGMPAARQHLRTVQRHADTRPDLEAGDRTTQERLAAHMT
jgi:hypothetical protein